MPVTLNAHIVATYLIETPLTLEAAAAVMAGEQSTGTFVRTILETDALRARHAATIEHIEPLGEVDSPSLSGSRGPRTSEPGRYARGRVTISWPLENVGPSLPNLLATVAGNLFELRELSGARLVDLHLPGAFADAYQGPAFGVDGTRALTGVATGPVLGTIVKPSVGLSPRETGALVAQLATAGLDFIKDDELMANPPHSPLAERVTEVMAVLDRHAERTGKRVMYAFNITDDIDQMRQHHDTVLAAGGTCVMVSLHSVGMTGLAYLRRHSQLPIHGHRNGWGIHTRHPLLGVEFTVMQRLWRLAGADHLHVNGLRNKFWEPDDSVIASALSCLRPLFADRPMVAMPAFSSGQRAKQAPETLSRLGRDDLMYLCGGGIMAHPMGVEAGVASIREAWDAARSGIELTAYAADHPALRAALAGEAG